MLPMTMLVLTYAVDRPGESEGYISSFLFGSTMTTEEIDKYIAEVEILWENERNEVDEYMDSDYFKYFTTHPNFTTFKPMEKVLIREMMYRVIQG